MSTGKYFRMELKRCLQSPDIYAGIAGAALLCGCILPRG